MVVCVNPNLSPITPVAGAIIVPYFMDVETQVPRGKGGSVLGEQIEGCWCSGRLPGQPPHAAAPSSPLSHLRAVAPPVRSLSLSLPPPPSGNTALG